jgi:HSP20 family protein
MKSKILKHEGQIDVLSEDIDRLFHGMVLTGHRIPIHYARAWRPPTDVYETDACVVVKVEIAGMHEDGFLISLDDRLLTISGVREDPAAKLAYQQFEIAYGPFRTEVYLPGSVEESGIEATYEGGFLKVVLPKARARKVPVLASARKAGKVTIP